ncbi:MAG TPA: murein biosynthesis integral membrane protein MurJ, partial [Actinotalea sp.]|nr:murein biosynthesis integral membrane protein MurJ [Actinotalea sp.]
MSTDDSGPEPTGRSAIGRSTAVMAGGTAVSRVLGVVRNAVLVAAVGVNAAAANAFAVANTIPNMLYMLVAGGVLNAVLVPQVVRAYRSDRGQAYVDRLLTLSVMLLAAITVLLTVAAPLIVRIMTSGADPEFRSLATVFAFWCIPQVFFYGLYTLLGQVLNARGSFGPYMWAPVVNNIVSIVGFLVFIAAFGRYVPGGPLDSLDAWESEQITLLAVSATLGIVAQALVLLFPLYRSGFRYRPRWDWRGSGLGTAGRVAGWTFAALVVGQLGIVVVSRVTTAATQVSGYAPDVAGNYAYNNAFVIFMLPHSLVTVSLLTALFTRLSAHASADDTARLRADTGFGLRTIGVVTVFASVVLAVLALPLVRVVLPSSSPAEAGSLAPVIVALAAGLTALGVWSLWQRVAYAYEDARSLFRIQVGMAVVVAAVSVAGYLLLPIGWWTAGAGAAIAASYVLGALWGGVQVRRRLGGSGARSVRVLALAALAAVASAAVGWPVSRLFGDLSSLGFARAAVLCAVVGLVMLAVYAGLLRVLGVEELAALVAPLVRPLTTRLTRSMGNRVGADQGRSAHGGDRVDVVVERGTLLAGRYRLDERVPTDLPGVESWRAEDQILDRPVRALVLREGRVRQAQDAARRAALVSDPRLLRVLDVGDHEGLPYVVTEPIGGIDLATLVAHGPLPADQARAIIGEAAVALEVARRRGVHHLALRPSAVHVLPGGGVLVSGLALDGELAGHGLGDARSTTRADTVGLVALLYLALTGRWPAPAGVTTTGTTVEVVTGDVPPAADHADGVPNDLDTLCAVTLGPHDDGPHSPAELVRELEPWGPLVGAEVLAGLAARAGADRGADASGPSTAVQGGPSDAPPDGPGADRPAPAEEAASTVLAPPSVQRTSVRSSMAQTPGPAVRPGTPPPAVPPPAIPPAVHRPDPRDVPPSAALAASWTAAAAVA